jgi:hypothetical protein
MQSLQAQYSMEAEYMAAVDVANEAVWLRKFIIKLRVFPSMRDPVSIHCDNTGAIANVKEPRCHSIVKHIFRRYRVMTDYVQYGEVKICKVHMDLNLADPLMKPLPHAMFNPHRESMGVRSLPIVN